MYERVLGAAVEARETIASQGAEAAALHDRRRPGRAARAARRRHAGRAVPRPPRAGMHHVAYEVDDLRAELARLDSEGVELVDREPRTRPVRSPGGVHPSRRRARRADGAGHAWLRRLSSGSRSVSWRRRRLDARSCEDADGSTRRCGRGTTRSASCAARTACSSSCSDACSTSSGTRARRTSASAVQLGMGLEVGIVGLPRSGKTTLFNALTRAGASLHDAKAHVGMAQIADHGLTPGTRGRLGEGDARHHPRGGRARHRRGAARQPPPRRCAPVHR